MTRDALQAPSSCELDDDIWVGVDEHHISSYNVSHQQCTSGGWLAGNDARSRLALHMNWHGRTYLLSRLDRRSHPAPLTPSSEDVRAVSPQVHTRRGRCWTPAILIHPCEDDLIPGQQSIRTMGALHE